MWGDGQIPYVVDHELAAIERCLEKVVMDSMIYGKPCNPPIWTVVDDVITCPRGNISSFKKYFALFCNFRSLSYNMVKVKATHKIQGPTYKQTNLYYNLFGIVRVPSLHKMPAEGHLDGLLN